MIIENLQPDANIWDGVTVVIRAAYYAASLGAAGLAMFVVGFQHRLTFLEAERTRRLLLSLAVVAVFLSLLAAAVRVQILSAGNVGDLEVWEAMFRSRIGDAFYLRVAGLFLLLPLALGWRLGPALAGAGALLVVGSYVAMGHSTLYRPRQELAAIVFLHLAAVAFWFGSLLPLRQVAARADGDAAALISDWSKAAAAAVALLTVAGLVGAWLLVRRPELMATSWYGNGMIAKLAIVAGAFGLAAWHKFTLTPRLKAGDAAAGARLSRSIALEIVVLLLAFYAAAEMVSVHPVDVGHRVQG